MFSPSIFMAESLNLVQRWDVPSIHRYCGAQRQATITQMHYGENVKSMLKVSGMTHCATVFYCCLLLFEKVITQEPHHEVGTEPGL